MYNFMATAKNGGESQRRSLNGPVAHCKQGGAECLNQKWILEECGRVGSQAVELRPREFALLEYLMRNAGKVLTKTMILSHVWGYQFDPQTNVVDVLVSRLRDKIDRPFDRKLLQTVRGVGYVLRA